MQPIGKIKAAAKLAVSPLIEMRERKRYAGLYTTVHECLDAEKHLYEAAQWLCRAQDHGSDRGVSYGCDFGDGFLPSYPETTGYIICTFLQLARHYADEAYLRRAAEMATWEAAVQMDCGAVMGGMYNTNPTPAVFNTGMVLLGWADLYRETAIEHYRIAGERAGRWLLQMQEANGQWIRGNSQFANAATTVYNVKAAWGLAEMGFALGENTFVRAAERNAEFALTRQLANGWFDDCCLEDANRPLLHTIAYTMQGLVGIGKITGRKEIIDAAARTAEALLKSMDADGFIPGRIDRDLRSAATWCCLTGTAQTSLVWSQLAALTGDDHFAQAAEQANRYLMARHDITSPNPSIRGGVAGSWPVWGNYGRFKVLSWATKFFADALLARAASARRSGEPASVKYPQHSQLKMNLQSKLEPHSAAAPSSMTVDDFYSLLCCPACKGDLQLRKAAAQFYCPSCSFTFPIVDGIPVLMPCDVIENMERLFGRYWDSEERAQLYDTQVEGSDIFGVHNHVSELQGLMHYIESGKFDLVLDAGCGNGRFLAALPPGTPYIGLDASLNLLRITRRKHRGQFHVCAELEHLPFRDAQFGTVISCRVLQHLVGQQEAVHEMCRVVRKQGIVVLELYNTWNPKTIYKKVRMSRYCKLFNAPFRVIFRSMSPFDEWGLTYDRYNNWFEIKRWLRECRMSDFRGRGVGFGYHKYLFEPFYIMAVLEKHAPRFLQRYFDACLWIEQRIGPLIPFRYTMEKFVIRAVKEDA